MGRPTWPLDIRSCRALLRRWPCRQGPICGRLQRPKGGTYYIGGQSRDNDRCEGFSHTAAAFNQVIRVVAVVVGQAGAAVPGAFRIGLEARIWQPIPRCSRRCLPISSTRPIVTARGWPGSCVAEGCTMISTGHGTRGRTRILAATTINPLRSICGNLLSFATTPHR